MRTWTPEKSDRLTRAIDYAKGRARETGRGYLVGVSEGGTCIWAMVDCSHNRRLLPDLGATTVTAYKAVPGGIRYGKLEVRTHSIHGKCAV